MNFLKNLGKKLTKPSQADRAMYLYVQCDRCREVLRARVDVWNELTPEYDDQREDAIAYHCRKVLVGENKCYQPIELQLRFDKNHRLVEKEIHGGKFVDEPKINS